MATYIILTPRCHNSINHFSGIIHTRDSKLSQRALKLHCKDKKLPTSKNPATQADSIQRSLQSLFSGPTVWPVVQSLSRVRLFMTLWTVAHQAPLSMWFPRQEYRSRLPFPSPGDLPDPGNEPASPLSLALVGGSLLLSLQGSPTVLHVRILVPLTRDGTQAPCSGSTES